MTQTTGQDPTTRYPNPSGEGEQQDAPGTTAAMREKPDHGEDTYVGHGRLTGRRAVITGGDSGIGRAVAVAFAREGADVLVTAMASEREDAAETVRLVEAAGRRGVAVEVDLREEDDCQKVVDTAVAELGGIDVLVSNAAYQQAQPGGLADITTEQLDRVFRTNIYAMFWLCQKALPHLRAGASIITTSSIEASQPKPPLLDYAATKAATVNFTRGLASQLAEQGIRVNSVAPGPIWTPLIPATMPADQVESFGEENPTGRAGQPVEVAPAYVYLASDEARYVSGEVLGVTGGKPFI